MQVLNFIIKNILTQAAVVVGLIALLGLVLQKKPIGTVVSGTMKTILGFLVLSAGSSVIQGSLAIFGDLFNKAFGLKGLVASIEGINGQAMTDLGLGSEIAITLAGIFIVNIILARITPFKYIFLTGQALLWGIYTLRSICLLLWIKRTSIDHRRINRWWCIRNINASIRTASYAADHR